MTTTILERLKSNVVPRIKLDLSTIESRFKKPERQKKKKEESNNDPSRISPQAEEYLRDVFDEPDVPVTARGDRLGYTSHITTKVKNELISKGLVKQYQVNLGRVNKFLEITEAGYSHLKVEASGHQGKGSPEHRYWQRKVLYHYKNSLGLKAKIEGQRKNKLVDVAVMEEDGKLLAVEIAITPKNEMNNIKLDLEVGFDHVLIACKNKKVKDEVERKIAAYLNVEDKLKVTTCLVTEFC